MFKPSVTEIMDVLQAKKFVFVGPELPYYLNIVGIRTENEEEPDTLVVSCYDEDGFAINKFFQAKLDISEAELSHEGGVSLCCGQYFNVFELREVEGKDKLIETSAVGVMKYHNDKMCRIWGHAKVSLHNSAFTDEDVKTGGQVILYGYEDFLKLCELHRKHHGNFFSYTLLRKKDF